jgi:hypothetical protein
VVEAPGYRGSVDPGVWVEGSPAGPAEEASAEEGLVSDREKLTRAIEERDRLSDRDERIIAFVGDMIDGGIWPYSRAVKNLGGREVMRRALVALDAMPHLPYEISHEHDHDPDPHRHPHSTRESAQARPADGEAAS